MHFQLPKKEQTIIGSIFGFDKNGPNPNRVPIDPNPNPNPNRVPIDPNPNPNPNRVPIDPNRI